MDTNTTENLTVTLAPLDGRVGVTAGDELLGTVKDGGQIVRNAEKLLRAAKVFRTTGYDLNADRALVAAAVRVA